MMDTASRSLQVGTLCRKGGSAAAALGTLHIVENAGGNDSRDNAAELRDRAGDERDQEGDRRDDVAERRDEAGDERDQAATRRDDIAEQRDQAGDERDRAADERDEVAVQSETSALNRSKAAFDRNQACQDRGAAASERSKSERDRATASADRGAGAAERSRAESDRNTAQADRGASATDREQASLDDLTGVYLRGPGVAELEREIARALRTKEPLALAFVDVDDLKTINDSHGHGAGDRALREVADTLRATLRSYDRVIRYGGDEFVCLLPGLDIAHATKRFALVNAALAKAPERTSITVGLAQLEPGDTIAQLIARADAALYRERAQRPAERARP